MTTGKAIALNIWTFLGKVMPHFFTMLSRFVIVFLPRSMHLFISRLQWPYSVTLEPMKVKSVTVSTFFPICLPWSDGTRYCGFHFLNFEGFFNKHLFIIIGGSLLYNITLILPYINMNLPQYTRVPHPELPTILPPHTIPLGHPSAPAPSIQYHASSLD